MSVAKFTRKELESRTTWKNATIIIDNVVYDVSGFLEEHPGGSDVLLVTAGKDASQCFYDIGHSDLALEWRQKFVIGEVVDEDKWEVLTRESYSSEPPEPLSLGTVLGVWGPPVAIALVAVLFYTYLFT